MLRGFFGNLIFAIIARMLRGNHLNIDPPQYLRDPVRLRDNIKNLRGINKLQVPKRKAAITGIRVLIP